MSSQESSIPSSSCHLMPESYLTIDTRTWSQPLGFFLDFSISYVQVHAFLSDEWKEQNNQNGSKTPTKL